MGQTYYMEHTILRPFHQNGRRFNPGDVVELPDTEEAVSYYVAKGFIAPVSFSQVRQSQVTTLPQPEIAAAPLPQATTRPVAEKRSAKTGKGKLVTKEE